MYTQESSLPKYLESEIYKTFLLIQFIAICIIVSWANPVICYLVKNNDMVTYCTILNHFTFILFFYQKSWVDYIHCKAIMQLNAFFFLKLFTLAPYNSKQAHSPMCMSEYMYPTLTLVFRSGELSGFDLKKIIKITYFSDYSYFISKFTKSWMKQMSIWLRQKPLIWIT